MTAEQVQKLMELFQMEQAYNEAEGREDAFWYTHMYEIRETFGIPDRLYFHVRRYFTQFLPDPDGKYDYEAIAEDYNSIMREMSKTGSSASAGKEAEAGEEVREDSFEELNDDKVILAEGDKDEIIRDFDLTEEELAAYDQVGVLLGSLRSMQIAQADRTTLKPAQVQRLMGIFQKVGDYNRTAGAANDFFYRYPYEIRENFGITERTYMRLKDFFARQKAGEDGTYDYAQIARNFDQERISFQPEELASYERMEVFLDRKREGQLLERPEVVDGYLRELREAAQNSRGNRELQEVTETLQEYRDWLTHRNSSDKDTGPVTLVADRVFHYYQVHGIYTAPGDRIGQAMDRLNDFLLQVGDVYPETWIRTYQVKAGSRDAVTGEQAEKLDEMFQKIFRYDDLMRRQREQKGIRVTNEDLLDPSGRRGPKNFADFQDSYAQQMEDLGIEPELFIKVREYFRKNEARKQMPDNLSAREYLEKELAPLQEKQAQLQAQEKRVGQLKRSAEKLTELQEREDHLTRQGGQVSEADRKALADQAAEVIADLKTFREQELAAEPAGDRKKQMTEESQTLQTLAEDLAAFRNHVEEREGWQKQSDRIAKRLPQAGHRVMEIMREQSNLRDEILQFWAPVDEDEVRASKELTEKAASLDAREQALEEERDRLEQEIGSLKAEASELTEKLRKPADSLSLRKLADDVNDELADCEGTLNTVRKSLQLVNDRIREFTGEREDRREINAETLRREIDEKAFLKKNYEKNSGGWESLDTDDKLYAESLTLLGLTRRQCEDLLKMGPFIDEATEEKRKSFPNAFPVERVAEQNLQEEFGEFAVDGEQVEKKVNMDRILQQLKEARTTFNSGAYKKLIQDTEHLCENLKKGRGPRPELYQAVVDQIGVYYRHKAADGTKRNAEPKLQAVEELYHGLEKLTEEYAVIGLDKPSVTIPDRSTAEEAALTAEGLGYVQQNKRNRRLDDAYRRIAKLGEEGRADGSLKDRDLNRGLASVTLRRSKLHELGGGILHLDSIADSIQTDILGDEFGMDLEGNVTRWSKVAEANEKELQAAGLPYEKPAPADHLAEQREAFVFLQRKCETLKTLYREAYESDDPLTEPFRASVAQKAAEIKELLPKDMAAFKLEEVQIGGDLTGAQRQALNNVNARIDANNRSVDALREKLDNLILGMTHKKVSRISFRELPREEMPGRQRANSLTQKPQAGQGERNRSRSFSK